MMRRPGGYGILTQPEGAPQEHDTFSCSHCNRVVRVEARQRADDIGGFCSVCAGLICPSCVGKGCDPLEEKLRRIEARADVRRSYGF